MYDQINKCAIAVTNEKFFKCTMCEKQNNDMEDWLIVQNHIDPFLTTSILCSDCRMIIGL